MLRRRRLAAAGLIAAVVGAGAVLAFGSRGRSPHVASRTQQSAAQHQSARAPAPPTPTPAPIPPPRHEPASPRRGPFAVGLHVLTLVDHSRRIKLPSGASVPRTLTTFVRYPAAGEANGRADRSTSPASAAGPFPLIVFGHGFAVTPGVYAHLLQAWTRAGYVVAAPVFPLENANAPGGPDESDLVNQPRDMHFVISALLNQSSARSGLLHQLIKPGQVAVAGQSDGGETALALAYDSYFRDFRVRAAAILSGAKIPGVGGFNFPAGSPPLLATQGSADRVNPPQLTRAFFDIARRPKYLLELPGASHLPPYSGQQPQLGIIERVTTAFFDLYLKQLPGAERRLRAQGSVSGIASLRAQP